MIELDAFCQPLEMDVTKIISRTPHNLFKISYIYSFMGKPFERELEAIPKTIEWAGSLDLKQLASLLNRISHPVYIVGSGGSFSACVYAANLLTSKGIFAKAVTPLELYAARPTLRNAHLLIISASGRNTDILFAFRKAVACEPISIISICMRKGTKLTALAANYSYCTSFEFEPPTGKDGFLATNSLTAYFVILLRAICDQPAPQELGLIPKSFYQEFLTCTGKETCFVILYSSTNQAVAVDLESKFSEAGLAPSLLSDFRHFAHGRHQWFDKKKNSAIIALSSPDDEKLCQKTLQLLPEEIPKLILHTQQKGFSGTIELLLQAMSLIRFYGTKVGIDPGRPGVPDYGSKIYHLRYEKLVADRSPSNEEMAILRKTKVNRLTDLTKDELEMWRGHYHQFLSKLTATRYGSLIFDYDGTLCSPANRLKGVGEEVKNCLLHFVKKGFVLGIVSGRGKSLREDMEKVFADHPALAKNVILGYYNGSDIAPLTNAKRPDKKKELHPSLQILSKALASANIHLEESPNQLMLGASSSQEWKTLRETLLNQLMLLDLADLTVVESSHSIDIIPRKIASKNHILQYCRRLCRAKGLPLESLCIGDRGQWPGNDFALLANDNALSVGDVSSLPNTGWNLSPPGIRDEKAVVYLFNKLKFTKGYFTMQQL